MLTVGLLVLQHMNFMFAVVFKKHFGCSTAHWSAKQEMRVSELLLCMGGLQTRTFVDKVKGS